MSKMSLLRVLAIMYLAIVVVSGDKTLSKKIDKLTELLEERADEIVKLLKEQADRCDDGGSSEESQAESCKDLKSTNPKAANGEYHLNNGQGQKYTAYCEFHGTYGYQFVSKEDKNFDQSALELISPSTSQVLVRHLRSNNTQYDTTMEQIPAFTNQVPLSIQYNQNVGYARPQNYLTWAPFLYLGFLPVNKANAKIIQGYKANGQVFSFTNCDANPNSYLAFFYNRNNSEPTDYHTKCCYTPLMRGWINAAVPASNRLPANYFFPFEMHLGGCGGYVINGFSTLVDVAGAALGMRFDM